MTTAFDYSVHEMTLRSRIPARAPFALRAACLLAVLVGIVGMHGLANHGVGGADAMPHTFIASMATRQPAPSVEDLGGLGNIELSPESSPGIGILASQAPAMPGGMDMTMAGLCLAILILGLGAMALWLRRRRTTSVMWVLPRPVAVIGRHGRAPDPPSLRQLSILRC